MLQIGDMSLADNATLCLSAVITQLVVVGAGEQIYKDVVLHTILDAVHKGLRSKTEVATHTFPSISNTLALYIKSDALNMKPPLHSSRACSMTTPPCWPAW